MKKYKNKNWIVQQLINGIRNSEMATMCNVSIYTISSSVAKVLNSLSIDEIIELVQQSKTPKYLISPKTNAYKKIVKATEFLPENSSIRERCWYIANNTTTSPQCKMCSSTVNWDHTLQQFRIYCSISCQSKDDEVQRKRKDTNLINHGVEYPASSECINFKRKQTLKSRYGVEHQNQRHIDIESLNMLNNAAEMHDMIHSLSTFEIADKLKVSQSVVSKYLRQHHIDSPRKTGSRYERELLSFIEQHANTKIITNSRQIIPPQEIDIYLPDFNLAFEFNGLFWHSELAGKSKHYHINKTLMCDKKGIRLIHIFEHKWKSNQELIKSRILNLLKQNTNRIYARKCEITFNIDVNVARNFFNENHIQGFSGASIYVGLLYENELISLMSFGKSRYNSKYEYELIRFCSKQNHSVIGGASKLFSHFVTNYSPSSIITYSDKTWNTGNVYEKMGFKFSHNSNPNYHYFLPTADKTLSRVKFQKHKLKNILRTFDPNKTEWENMKDNGYNKIWDCGNGVFIWNPK